MTNHEMINAFVSGIRSLVDPTSNIQLLLGSILTAEIHLKPNNKEKVCHEINKLLILIKAAAPIKMILAVIDDDNDRYIRLIGKGINGHDIDSDAL